MGILEGLDVSRVWLGEMDPFLVGKLDQRKLERMACDISKPMGIKEKIS